MKKYQIIYADPPWEYARKQFEKPTQDNHAIKVGTTGGAIVHYSLMNEDSIKRLPVKDIAYKDCLLFLWVPSPKLPTAVKVGISWGFDYVTVGFVWNKVRVNPGYYTMSVCELCLIFKRGRIPTPRGRRNIEQFYREMRTCHSKKPDEFRNRITQMFPIQNKVELFARQRVEGWDCWGNEVESDMEL